MPQGAKVHLESQMTGSLRGHAPRKVVVRTCASARRSSGRRLGRAWWVCVIGDAINKRQNAWQVAHPQMKQGRKQMRAVNKQPKRGRNDKRSPDFNVADSSPLSETPNPR